MKGIKYLIATIITILSISIYSIYTIANDSKLELSKIQKNINDDALEIKSKKLEDLKQLKLKESNSVKNDYINKVENFVEEITIEKPKELYVIPGITVSDKYIDENQEITILKNIPITITKAKDESLNIKENKTINIAKNQLKESDYINNNINNNKQELNDLYAILKDDSINKPNLDLTPKYQEEEFLKKLASN